MKQWEYKRINHFIESSFDMDNLLREWGAEGWELIVALPCGTMTFILIFKRPFASGIGVTE